MSAPPRTPAIPDGSRLDDNVRKALVRRREAILAHPRFEEARRVEGKIQAELGLVERFPGQMKVDIRRMMLIGLILNVEATAEEADPSTWPTPVRLKACMRQVDMDGPRRIDEVVARLVQTGYIRLEPHPGDRRVKWVRSQEPLRAWFLEWIGAYLEALNILFPDPDGLLTARLHPGFLRAYLRSSWRHSAFWPWVLQENARFAAFVRSDHALRILRTVERLEPLASGGGVREVDLLESIRPYGLSRSHLRDTLARALDHSYIARSGPRGQYWSLTPEGRTDEARFFADGLATTEANYRNALRDTMGEP